MKIAITLKSGRVLKEDVFEDDLDTFMFMQMEGAQMEKPFIRIGDTYVRHEEIELIAKG